VTRHLLVIGAQRCGTSALHHLLDAHPDITMARPARPEPKVFCSEQLSAHGLQWYRERYFAHATTESLWGDKSTSYLDTPGSAGRAAAVLGRADVVAQLRDPVARAVSHWRFSSSSGREDRPLEQALKQTMDGERPWDGSTSSVSPYAYLDRGRYIEHLRPWFSAFPGSVHVLFLEETSSQPSAVSSLYRRLGVDPGFRPPGVDRPVNSSDGPAPRLDASLERALRSWFADSDAQLAAALGRSLPWARGN
jgi:hypothetical protein